MYKVKFFKRREAAEKIARINLDKNWYCHIKEVRLEGKEKRESDESVVEYRKHNSWDIRVRIRGAFRIAGKFTWRYSIECGIDETSYES